MSKRYSKILISAVIATALCQLGMMLTCIDADSVMHMPTIKNTAVVFVVALLFAIGTEVLFGQIIFYSKKCAAWLLLICFFLLLTTVQTFIHPIRASDGRIAYRYPELAVIALVVYVFRLISERKKPSFKGLIKKPDFREPSDVFLVIVIIAGITMALLLPRKTVVCWDDDEHYRETLFFSEGIYTAFDDTDVNLIYGWKDDAAENLSELENNGSLYLEANALAFRPERTGQLGFVAGIWAGRALNLNANGVFVAGRLGGLFLYALIMYCAIKRLKNGKMLLAIIGLSPIAVFMSVGYSYDSWLLAFMSLAFSYFFGSLQRETEELSYREIAIMLGGMFIGVFPKMPYIFMMLFFLLMPKQKFVDAKQQKIYIATIISCIVFTFVYTLIASLNSGHVGDYRGGNDINAYEQLAKVIANPWSYLVVLAGFLKSYFGSAGYLSSFAHLGETKAYLVLVFAMLLAALTDNETKTPLMRGNIRISEIAIAVLQIAMVATIFYLVYTPVGADEILGCQTRYKLQLIFPFMMCLLSGWIVIPEKKRRITSICWFVISSGCLAYNIISLL